MNQKHPAARLRAWSAIAVLALAAQAHAGSQTYVAREGNLYSGTDAVVDDSGAPSLPGVEGDLFEQILTYVPVVQGVYEERTVFWDDNTELLVGFTDNASSVPFTARATETVTWRFSGDAWIPSGSAITTQDGSTGIVERTPQIAPYTPPSGGAPDQFLSELEIQELEMAGFDYAMQQYLDSGYNLRNVTREQLQQDMRRLEAYFAGTYTPAVPEPESLGLIAAGGVLLALAVRRRGRSGPHPTRAHRRIS